MRSLDDVRAKYPHLGIALYAFEPGKSVTLELITDDGKTFKFTARSEADAIKKAFDEDAEAPVPEPTTKTEPIPPPTSVFD
jgi:hypothetical protein